MTAKDKNTFSLEDFKLNPISSAENIRQNLIIDDTDEDILSLNAAPIVSTEADSIALSDESTEAEAADETEESDELSKFEDPIFKELAEPKLPELARDNRARLQMQSPTKIYFYWSFQQNPFQTLNRVFGNHTNYQLVAKLVNQTNEREEIFPIDAEGMAWFDADADSMYQVEIGFYAVNRPFVRVMFSNEVETPRKNPSSRQDYSSHFAVSANQFAEVLDVSGFQQDAFEVALAGDDIEFADNATQTAFAQVLDEPQSDFDANKSSEIRFILLALASGYRAETLREHVSPSLFSVLESHAGNLSAEKALAALQSNFGVFADETFEVEEPLSAATVFGASLINFPRLSKRRMLPKFSPISSIAGKYF